MVVVSRGFVVIVGFVGLQERGKRNLSKGFSESTDRTLSIASIGSIVNQQRLREVVRLFELHLIIQPVAHGELRVEVVE